MEFTHCAAALGSEARAGMSPFEAPMAMAMPEPARALIMAGSAP